MGRENGRSTREEKTEIPTTDGRVSTARMENLEPPCRGWQSGLRRTVPVASLQHTRHHRGVKKTGYHRHLPASRNSLSVVVAEEGAAMGSQPVLGQDLITLAGAPLEGVVDSAETPSEGAIHLMKGLVQWTYTTIVSK